MFRKFFIWLTKSLIALIIATLIFSSFALDLPLLTKGIFKNIFQYSNPEMQKETVDQLTQFCSNIDDKDTASMQQELSKRGFLTDLSKLGALCKDYKNGTISKNEFFIKTIETTLPDKFELPKNTAFEKYNQAINLANQNKIIYVTILLVLILMLYFLSGSPSLFLTILTEISLSIGTLILAPYLIITIYIKFAGIDTTPILSAIFGGSTALDIKSIISIILLMILRTYTALIVILGVIFLAIGITGKIYTHKLKKTETGPKKKTKSEDKELEEELDRRAKEKEKNLKEVLDELEEVQKKKKS